ncbi:hypothetical protein F2Q69_00039237 [Brassica cretica]|uniref:YTH domain-containing family protein n=1 Tax=Brassica cretica TaxID=69181 RepID=A0A8S9SGJ6_BRACR|nr:hypothetical protein F2Q69_00039237 [Brassica cretica]
MQPYGIQSMLKEGYRHLSGLDEAVIKNIEACKELSTITRTSLGPNGMNKMVINHLDKLFVTNDAATIVNELEIQHPAAKILVLAAKAQQEEIGDGANLTISFAGELLQNAEELIRMGEEKADRLNELCRGPRSSEGLDSTTKQDAPVVESFPETLVNAKFFVIKSYSEDDVHNSIKYGMWSSTPTGNKKLNAAYQESSQECPVYLLFSVNASGQFVGVAEMIGAVDFNKTMEYWQQDKWIGCFPVKWRIIKDVPNSLLRHITLVNNENKPVTNSRDTQEVKLEDGIKIIKIFKEYMSKTCILDDFKFYETRQKIIRDKKVKQKKQVLDGASVETIP